MLYSAQNITLTKREIPGSHGGECEYVFWVVAPCSLVEVCWRFWGACCLHHQGDEIRPEDGGSKNPWNVGKLLLDYTAQQPRRQPSSYIYKSCIFFEDLLSCIISGPYSKWCYIATTSQVLASATLFCVFCYQLWHWKVQVRGSFQWHNVRIKFHQNLSSCSEVEAYGQAQPDLILCMWCKELIKTMMFSANMHITEVPGMPPVPTSLRTMQFSARLK
jgi:hypothetical protein